MKDDPLAGMVGVPETTNMKKRSRLNLLIALSNFSGGRDLLLRSVRSLFDDDDNDARRSVKQSLFDNDDDDDFRLEDTDGVANMILKSFRLCGGKSSFLPVYSMSPDEVMSNIGRGGVSRMFVRGVTRDLELSSVGRFFSKGSTLERATAFTKSAAAYDRNASNTSARTNACILGASEEHPVQEMEFFNIGGAKVFYYYGLDTVRSPDHVMGAGPHVRDTAIGVLMLDQYKIHERPGDPSNPLTFWPYQTFFVIPQGITFAKCKNVGSAGANSLRDYPLETNAICQALLALAEVASRRGFKRLMIVGDCGYYALSAEAFAKNLSCWGSQSWLPHPDGAFASFRTPHFRSPSLDLDIILSLGTTQLISSPEPQKNLSTQLGADTSVVYLTADTRGWYGGEALKRVEHEYEPFLDRPWVTDHWHFNLTNEISPFDIVTQVNVSLLQGVAIENGDDDLLEVVETLLEIDAGSTAYVVGLYLGHIASQLEEGGLNHFERAWFRACNLTELIKDMAQDIDGRPHSKDVIIEKVSPVFDYLKPLLEKIASLIQDEDIKDLTEEDEFQITSMLIGNPLPMGSTPPSTYNEFKLGLALRIQDTFLSLLSVAKRANIIAGLPLGNNFVGFYALFNANLNHDVLSEIKRSHAIDGRTFLLFDCRYVPGFGFNVSQGLTVWTKAHNYYWMSSIILRFSEIMQSEQWMGAAAFHLECTELFSFTPFFHEMGIPVIDGVNALIIASRSTDAPIRFVNFKQEKKNEPPTPSALVADVSEGSAFGVSYYRDHALPLRTTTQDAKIYKEMPSNLMAAQKARWCKLHLARPLFKDFKLLWGWERYIGSKPSDSIYPASSALDIPQYVKDTERTDGSPTILEGQFVQYAPEGENRSGDNFDSFFGGDLYLDKRVGRRSIAFLTKK